MEIGQEERWPGQGSWDQQQTCQSFEAQGLQEGMLERKALWRITCHEPDKPGEGYKEGIWLPNRAKGYLSWSDSGHGLDLNVHPPASREHDRDI